MTLAVMMMAGTREVIKTTDSVNRQSKKGFSLGRETKRGITGRVIPGTVTKLERWNDGILECRHSNTPKSQRDNKTT